MIDINVAGIPEVKQYLKNVSIAATKSMPIGLAKASIFVQGEVKKSIAGHAAEPQSVDTGRFLNSVGIGTNNKDQAVVYSSLSYAKKLEYGFRGFTGRKHFENSGHRSKNRVEEIISKELKKQVNSVKASVTKIV